MIRSRAKYSKNLHWNYSKFELRFNGSVIWAASSKKVPSKVHKLRRLRSSCICTKYHPGVCSPFIHSRVSNDFVGGQWRSCSDCGCTGWSTLPLSAYAGRYAFTWCGHIISDRETEKNGTDEKKSQPWIASHEARTFLPKPNDDKAYPQKVLAGSCPALPSSRLLIVRDFPVWM